MEDKYYSVEEISNILGLHPQTIRRAIKAKRIVGFRPGIGKRSPFRIHEIELKRMMGADFESIQKAMEN